MSSRFTIALDKMLRDPRFADIAAHLRTHLPTGFVDQADAAGRDAAGTFFTIGRAIGSDGGAFWNSPDDVPDWLRLGVIDALRGWVDGTASTCMHNPQPTSPQPVLAAACKPGLIVCRSCLRLLTVAGKADRTCDACGHECTGPEHDDGIYPGAINLGVLVYQYGACESCHADLRRRQSGT